jgi:hypothetical protein
MAVPSGDELRPLWRASSGGPLVDVVDDLGLLDPARVGRGDPEVGMPRAAEGNAPARALGRRCPGVPPSQGEHGFGNGWVVLERGSIRSAALRIGAKKAHDLQIRPQRSQLAAMLASKRR